MGKLIAVDGEMEIAVEFPNKFEVFNNIGKHGL